MPARFGVGLACRLAVTSAGRKTTVFDLRRVVIGYYVAYKPITLSCILFMFIEIKFIHCHSCVMLAMKSISMCND